MDTLSDIVAYMKYCRFIEDQNRRETWSEMITRNMYMHILKFPKIKDDIIKYYSYVYNKKVLPSMRSLQMAGKPIFRQPQRIFNCCYAPIQDTEVFSEIFYLLLCGCGCGFSLQHHHIEKLPKINKANKMKEYVINDDIESWADSVKVLLNGYLTYEDDNNNFIPVFDYSEIRQEGKKLKTTGGFSCGSTPLRNTLEKIKEILDNKNDGEQLLSIEIYDILCHVAEAVYAGGIRRSAMICLFSKDDELMLNAEKSY